MKGFVTVILFFLFAIVCAKATHIDAATTARSIGICAVHNAANDTSHHTVNTDAIVPIARDKGVADMEEIGDAHSLAHRVSTSAERMYRFSSIETTQFIKNLLRRMATRMANLANCHTRVYDTSRSLSWDNACEHYIFGMRRILI